MVRVADACNVALLQAYLIEFRESSLQNPLASIVPSSQPNNCRQSVEILKRRAAVGDWIPTAPSRRLPRIIPDMTTDGGRQSVRPSSSQLIFGWTRGHRSVTGWAAAATHGNINPGPHRALRCVRWQATHVIIHHLWRATLTPLACLITACFHGSVLCIVQRYIGLLLFRISSSFLHNVRFAMMLPFPYQSDGSRADVCILSMLAFFKRRHAPAAENWP